ncbi:MAG: hypothetical protein SRB2_04252 [Desulfobacteraceae bacterium Eth-SRB2]|nr:MAG: hypothetical protein SRB2_04252 [Desulfobacteraceae bacterium Eth-SRB2]
MTWIVKACKNLTMVLVLFAFLAVAENMKDWDSLERRLDDTVKELAGKKSIDRMEEMKKDINKARQQQADRFKKIDESAEEK